MIENQKTHLVPDVVELVEALLHLLERAVDLRLELARGAHRCCGGGLCLGLTRAVRKGKKEELSLERETVRGSPSTRAALCLKERRRHALVQSAGPPPLSERAPGGRAKARGRRGG